MPIGRVRDRFRRILGRPGTVDLSRYRKLLPEIEAREPELRDLDDRALTAAVTGLKKPFGPAELVEFCALGREAARRALDERPYDVQLLGAMGLLAGHVIEMATGEGKTLAGAIA